MPSISDGLIASLAQSILAVAQSNFRDLQGVPIENIVLLSVIPDYPNQDQVEVSKEIWPTVCAIVHSVTIALESGAFPSGLLDASMQRHPLTETVLFLFSLLPLQKCQPRTSADATPRTCPTIRNQELKIAQHHRRLYCHYQHPPLPWHPHRAKGSSPSPNDPATRRGPASSGLDKPESASPSSICTRHRAFQTSQSRCCSRLPGVSLRCILHRRLPPHLMNMKLRTPSPGQSRRSPAAHSSTRLLARRFLTCTGRRGKLV